MFEDSIIELGVVNTAVLALSLAGLAVFITIRAISWAKGGLS